MMNTSMLPALALSTGEIVSILIAIGVILSGILGQANETKKTQKRRQSAKRGDMPEGGSVTQLDEIAQRRRQQLEALARQRRGGQAPQNQSAAVQRSDREAHRTASDELAAAVRAKETRDSVRWSDPGDRNTQANAMEARSVRQTTRQQRESPRDIRRREVEQKAERKLQQQQQQQRERQLQRQRQRSASRQQQPARPPALVQEERMGRRVLQSDEDRQRESDAQHALDQVYAIEGIDQPAGPTAARPVASKMAGLLGGRGWREALVLKEVLDRPVSMRNE